MKIKTIDINCLEWFDKVNGNSYFASQIIVNYGMKTAKIVNIHFQYGYGEHYIHESFELLKENKIIKTENKSLFNYCEQNKIILRYNKQTNCKKRDLMQF